MKHDIVVMGASAGGAEALTSVVRGLPAPFPGTIFVALHISGQSALPEILGRQSPIPVSHATDGEAQKDALERALWIAARSLRERVLAEPFLSRRIGPEKSETRARLLEHADAAERDLELIRAILAQF